MAKNKARRFPIKDKGAPQGRPEDSFQQFGYDNTNADTAEAEALRITKWEKTQWETAFAYITEKVAFNMRQVIRQCRKNYWGIFDQPLDPTTGREKLWEHLTKTFVDYVVTAYDLDTKDVTFRAKSPNAIPLTSVVRSIVKNKLEEVNFGEQLDLALRQLAIDGTVVWIEKTDDDQVGFSGLDALKIRLVDLLNFYIDPTVDSIAEADSIIERIVVPFDEFERLAKDNNWANADITGKKQVSRYDSLNNPGYNTQSDITFVEIYRRRGLAKEYIITGNTQDQRLVPTEIICSGTNGNWFFHAASRRKDNTKKGYDEGWLTRVHGRWYGEGIAERLLQKQLHFNIISNIRVNRAYLSQMGLFLVRKGSGITPQMLSRLATNGAISVTNIETDIKQLQQDTDVSGAIQEENLLYQWAQRYTGATDSVIGSGLPASTPATNASLQSQAGNARFTLVKEGISMFLKRFFKHQFMPAAMSTVTQGEIIRMHLEPQDMQEIHEKYLVNPQIAAQLQKINAAGGFIDPQQVMQAKQQAMDKLGSFPELFVKLLHTVDITQYDVDIDISDEDFDKNSTVQALNQTMQTLVPLVQASPTVINSILQMVRQEMDLLGLNSSLLQLPSQSPQQGQQAPQQTQQPQTQQGGGPNQQSQLNAASPMTQPGGNPTQFPQSTPTSGVTTANTLQKA